MAQLVIESGPEAGFVYPVSRDDVTIGRSPHCPVQILDRRVSREHARLRFHRGSYILEDLESRNGTFLNHQPLVGVSRLESGDRISVGGMVMVFELDSQDEEAERRDRQRVRLKSGELHSPQMETPVNWDVTPVSGVSVLSRQAMQDPVQRLRAIYAMADSLRGEMNTQDLLWKIMDVIWSIAHPDRAIILSLTEETNELRPALIRTEKQSDEEIIISSSIAERCLRERVAILIADAPSDERFSSYESVQAGQVRSAICAPMLTAGKALGVIYLDLQFNASNPSANYTRDDLDLVSGIAFQASMALYNARLNEDMRKHQRVEKELEIAREIQVNLLPKSYPALPGVQFAAMCLPARQVGGDYYDFMEPASSCVSLVVGDVSGKGIPAAMMVNTVRAGMRAQSRITPPKSPGEMVQALNVTVCMDGLQGDLVTIFLLSYNAHTRQLRYTNAGHVPPIVARENGCIEYLDVGGPLLGAVPDARYPEAELIMGPGDTVLLFTDGVTETHNLSGAMFGMERLEKILHFHRAESSEQIREAIYQGVVQFRESRAQYDDFTLVVMKIV